MAFNGLDVTITRDMDRRISELQNALDVGNVTRSYELRLLHQAIGDVHKRLDQIELRLAGPSRTESIMELARTLLDRLWFKMAILAALATGNQQLVELLQSALK